MRRESEGGTKGTRGLRVDPGECARGLFVNATEFCIIDKYAFSKLFTLL